MSDRVDDGDQPAIGTDTDPGQQEYAPDIDLAEPDHVFDTAEDGSPLFLSTQDPPMYEGADSSVNGQGLHEELATKELANDAAQSLRDTGELPPDYITKGEAEQLGWEPGKALANTAPDRQIGGDVFHDYDGLMQDASPGPWYEADVGLDYRMSRANNPGTRLLYSEDGLMYVTNDHFDSAHYLGRWK